MSSITDEIKGRVDLVELVGRTVTLKRVGALYRGLCPFHTEKTPSFYVRPQTQSWHCYGCGKSGTAFDWLMEREHVEFGDALRTLANLTGVALPEHRDPAVEDQSRRLATILSRAQAFYAGMLWGTAGARCRDYLARRGLTDATLNDFGIGYAPSGNGLLRYLEKDGYSEQDLQAAGVIGVTEEEGRPYDFFRDRVLFPIRDAQGRTIAFGGRSLDDGATPKYLNSRDTLLFHKQETLFALDLARKPMSQERQVVIVEGYVDAVMAHQHGYRNVVATLGTAVTDRHLRLLRRQVDEIVLALDADAAGQAATWRALQVADESLRVGVAPVLGPNRRKLGLVPDRAVHLRVLALPNAKDPDELIRGDPQAWPALVRAAVPVIEFVLERLAARHDLTTAQGKAAAADEIAEVLAGIASPIEQDHYVNEAASRLKVEPDAVRRLLRARQPGRQRLASTPPPVATTSSPAREPVAAQLEPLDDYLLALLMRMREVPELAGVEVGPLDFLRAESRAVYDALGEEIPAALVPYATSAQRWLPDVARLSPPELLRGIEEKRLEIRRARLLRHKDEITALVKGGGEAEISNVLGPLVALVSEIAAIEQQLRPERERAGTA